ncbi:MAG TPA: response regulator transcription factor [Gemmatimonadaceae bacterium]|nr:response regulator transcription factor [Gemmatimonadaceae bacterium]
MRALVVDDDPTMADIVSTLLKEEGFVVDVMDTAEAGRVQALVTDYDLIILDFNLPDGNGISVIQSLRREQRDTPILMLTGSASPGTTVLALDAGADDYLTKPIKFDEFSARVRALVRRGGAKRTEHLSVGNVVLNRLSRAALVAGKPLHLTPRELSLLEHFMMHAGEVVSRTELLDKVLERSFDPGTNVVDVNVTRLRGKLRDASATVSIDARRGVGFVFGAKSL